MILFASFAAMMMAPNAASIDAPRKAYVACLRAFQTTSLAAKMPPAAFSAALKTACPAEAERLTQALVAFDVGMGARRAKALANAAIDLESYVVNAEESYIDRFGPAPGAQ